MRYLSPILVFLVCCATLPRPMTGTVGWMHAVNIHVQCGELGHSGSGVLIAPDLVLTAAHVMHCETGVVPVTEVTTWSGQKTRGDRLWMVLNEDLAMVSLREKVPGKGATIAHRIPFVGERVCVLTAHPYRERLCSPVVAIKGQRFDYSARTVPGNSGSGVYDASGHLVGIVAIRYTCPGGIPCGGSASTLLRVP